MAERTRISDKTVRHHLTSIFSKLEITDHLALVLIRSSTRSPDPADPAGHSA